MKQQLSTDFPESSNKNQDVMKDKNVALPYNIELLSILKDAVIITDEKFKICYWNPAAEEIYGWKSSEVIGKTAKEVLRTKFIGNEKPDTSKMLNEKGSYENEFLQFTKKNFPLYISSKIVTITDESGVINGHISINRDMTSTKNIEKKLKRSYNILNSIVENTTDAIYLKNLSGNYIMANTAASKIMGKPVADIIGKNDWDLYQKRDADIITREDKEIIENVETLTYEESLYSKREGEIRNYITTKGPYMGFDDSILGIFGIGRDITHLKLAEEKIIKSEQRYRRLFETMIQGVIYQDSLGRITAMNPSAEKILGYNLAEIQGKTLLEIVSEPIHEDGSEFLAEEFPSHLALKSGMEIEDVIFGLKTPIGHKWLSVHAVPLFQDGDKPFQVYTTFYDVTDKIIGKNKLKISEKRYRSLFNKITEGFALHEIVCNHEGEPVDYKFLDINPAFEELTGLKREDVLGKLKSEIIPEDTVDWVKIYGRVALEGVSIHFNEYSSALNRHYDVLAFSPSKNQFAVIFNDITHRVNIENELKETLKQLKLTNSELVQFAYIASHDLKEPLRVITSFLQLLQRRYKDKLDDDANDFINFAVDGSIRLHELIDDLLLYSKINTKTEDFTCVDMNEVLEIVKTNLDILIRENDAVITSGKLPKIWADKIQMIQLLQNLINNSIKYRGIQSPKIHISAKIKYEKWVFSVEDNGIGIPSKYSKQIFKIFKRLHDSHEYNGTGIGLAISKRIVEKHGGSIWVDTDRINGTKFNFSLRSG
jgi:PAS domain S-box-containing protein